MVSDPTVLSMVIGLAVIALVGGLSLVLSRPADTLAMPMMMENATVTEDRRVMTVSYTATDSGICISSGSTVSINDAPPSA